GKRTDQRCQPIDVVQETGPHDREHSTYLAPGDQRLVPHRAEHRFELAGSVLPFPSFGEVIDDRLALELRADRAVAGAVTHLDDRLRVEHPLVVTEDELSVDRLPQEH